jgi:DNA-directed RNA polymerase specialized sigma24 family protein
MFLLEESLSEQDLMARCLTGDQSAWNFLFNTYKAPLTFQIKSMVKEKSNDQDLVEEILERVWEALVEKGMDRLRVFDPKRCKLIGYLTTIAGQQYGQMVRSRRKRERHEIPLHYLNPDSLSSRIDETTIYLKEIRSRLKGRQKEFLEKGLLEYSEKDKTLDLTPRNIQRLTHRLFRKVKDFLVGS